MEKILNFSEFLLEAFDTPQPIDWEISDMDVFGKMVGRFDVNGEGYLILSYKELDGYYGFYFLHLNRETGKYSFDIINREDGSAFKVLATIKNHIEDVMDENDVISAMFYVGDNNSKRVKLYEGFAEHLANIHNMDLLSTGDYDKDNKIFHVLKRDITPIERGRVIISLNKIMDRMKIDMNYYGE